jgi:hypothetical protein
MNPAIAPQFAQLCARLREVQWLSRVGIPTPLVLPFSYRFVSDVVTAADAIAQPDWEDWTLERGNDTTSFLSKRFPSRDASWNLVVRTAKEFMQSELEPRLLPALSSALPGSKAAVDAVRWDVVSALMEAAYADCHPPLFFTHLIAVYEAGHLPVGWDASSEPGTLLVY